MMQYFITLLTKHGNAKYAIKTAKYDWGQIINHVNNKRNEANKEKGNKSNKANKGPHISPNGDKSITREIDFGLIRMIYEQERQNGETEKRIGEGDLNA